MLKVKHLHGKLKDTVTEVEDSKGTSLVEDGLAELVAKSESDLAIDALKAEFSKVANECCELAVKNAVSSVTKGLANTKIKVGHPNEIYDESGGYQSISHFMTDVLRCGYDLNRPTDTMTKYMSVRDIKLKIAGATPTGIEGVPSITPGLSDGAPIPIGMLSEIYKVVGEQEDFEPLTFPVPMNSQSTRIPVNAVYNLANTDPTQGLIVNEAGEANKIPPSKILWEQRLFVLQPEQELVPVSNEVLSDNNVGWAQVCVASALFQLKKKVNGGVMRGATPSCTGIIGAPATKVVGRQVAGQIGFKDILNMVSGFHHGGMFSFAETTWVGHPNILSAAFTSTVGSFPAMLVPGAGATGTPFTILGRPLILTGWASSLGITGDLSLVSFKDYLLGKKGEVDIFVSQHVYADSNQTAFRFIRRINGQLGRSQLTTLQDGVTTVSPYVTLGTVGGLS